MKRALKQLAAISTVMALVAWPSLAMAQTDFAESAATEITLLIPQATIIGVAVIGVLGVILAIMAVIGMMKHL